MSTETYDNTPGLSKDVAMLYMLFLQVFVPVY